VPRRRLELPTPQPYELPLGIRGHGWYALAPNRFDENAPAFHTVLLVGGDAIDATVTPAAKARLGLELTAHRRITTATATRAAQQIRHMLRLDDDLSAFYAHCAQHERLAWVRRRGAGRLLRSPTVFEDLMKLLFTTNTTWAGTESMVQRLVDARGEVAPSGARAFPSPEAARADEAFYQETVRAGYRAKAAVQLADAFARGTLDDATFLHEPSSDALWRRLLSLRGFGPYAAGQAMRLCGHYDPLALDSWCRARLAAMGGKRRPPSDRTIARRYAAFSPYAGLALWLDLTAEWHGEG
jgi:3-methyladenine DNA glycosylase/8-oxoguanine DNA glycosylase